MVNLDTAESVVVRFPQGLYIYTKLPPKGKSKTRRWSEAFISDKQVYSEYGSVYDSTVRESMEMGQVVEGSWK
jgi:hypothetical protein